MGLQPIENIHYEEKKIEYKVLPSSSLPILLGPLD